MAFSRARSILVGVSALVATALSLHAVPAAAFPGNWVVTQGGTKSATVGDSELWNTAADLNIYCTAGNLVASIPNKSNQSTTLGTLSNISMVIPSEPGSKCYGIGRFIDAYEIKPIGLPWTLLGTSYAAPGVSGRVTGVKFRIIGDFGCDAVLAGPEGGPGMLDVGYDNSTGRLTFREGSFGNLRVWSTSGLCDSELLKQGDPFALHGAFQISGTSTNWPQITKTP